MFDYKVILFFLLANPIFGYKVILVIWQFEFLFKFSYQICNKIPKAMGIILA